MGGQNVKHAICAYALSGLLAAAALGVPLDIAAFAAEAAADLPPDNGASLGETSLGETSQAPARPLRKAAAAKPKPTIKKPGIIVAQAPVATSAQPKPATPASVAAPAHIGGGPDISTKLREGGAGTCATQLNAAAASVMGGVARSNTISNWAKTVFDKRLVSVSIGQKFNNGTNVPYGATSIIAAPAPAGPCDTIAVQVIPSPISCDHIREEMTMKNQIIGDLAGVLVLQDPAGQQTMLVPTAANTCVLVGIRTAYAN